MYSFSFVGIQDYSSQTSSPAESHRSILRYHIFLTVSDMKRPALLYEAALASLGINEHFDFDGKNGPPGYPDLKGFGASGRLFLWLRERVSGSQAVNVGLVANNWKQVDADYATAIAAGAIDNGAPAARLYYDPRYNAANVLDPNGYSIEFAYKNGSTHEKRALPD